MALCVKHRHVPGRCSVATLKPTRANMVAGRQGRPRLNTVEVKATGMVSSSESMAYAALGASALGFVGTFFVTPLFKNSFKEGVEWKEMYRTLLTTGVKSVSADQAASKLGKSGVLVDVRLPFKHTDRRPVPSINVPVYIAIQKWDVPSIIRRIAFSFFGVYGTELNKNFVQEVEAAVPKGKDIYLICERGGSLVNKPGTLYGFESRSLKAYYFLQQAGFNRIYHVQGGLIGWQQAKLAEASGDDS